MSPNLGKVAYNWLLELPSKAEDAEDIDLQILYHSPCDDGYGAAFAFWLSRVELARFNITYVPINYNQIETISDFVARFPKYKDQVIVIVDFSIPNYTVMKFIRDQTKSFIWLDHHATSYKIYLEGLEKETGAFVTDKGYYEHFASSYDQERFTYIRLDNDYSGALLAWNFLNPYQAAPLFFQHLDDRDRWIKKIRDTDNFTRRLRSYPFSFAIWEDIMNRIEYTGSNSHAKETAYMQREVFYQGGIAINDFFNQQLKQILEKSKFKLTLDGVVGLASNANHTFASEVGHELAKESGTFGCSFSFHRDLKYVYCSLRSNSDFDVEALAKKFGGGGHVKSSGCRIPIAEFLSSLEEIPK